MLVTADAALLVLSSVARDIRHAARALARSPVFSVTSVVALAIGVSSVAVTFSIFQGVLQHPLSFQGGEHIVGIGRSLRRERAVTMSSTVPLSSFHEWRTSARSFEAMASYIGRRRILSSAGPAKRVWSWSVSGSFFGVLGVRPQLGRSFVEADDEPSGAPSAILSHGLWLTTFGAESSVIGQNILIDSCVVTIVGVMPQGFEFPEHAAVWTTLAMEGATRASGTSTLLVSVLARLRAGITVSAAQGELTGWHRNAPPSLEATAWVPVVRPLSDILTGHVRRSLWFLMAAVSVVLVTASANVASLAMSRSRARRYQVALRAALGASRVAQCGEAIAESAMIAAGGAALAVLLTSLCVPLAARLLGPSLPYSSAIVVDARVMLCALGLSVIAGLIPGVIPAWRASGQPAAQVLSATGTRTASSRSGKTHVLVAGQLAVTTTLLLTTFQLLRSLVSLNRLDPGFESRNVAVVEVQLPASRYGIGRDRSDYARQVLEEVTALPGVTAAAFGSGIPLSGGMIARAHTAGGASQGAALWIAGVSEDYFRTLGIAIRTGRSLTDGDANVVLIDEVAAREYFGERNPIGRAFGYLGSSDAIVVGVVENVRQALTEMPEPHLYFPFRDHPTLEPKFIVATNADPRTFIAALRQRVERVDVNAAVHRVAPLRELMASALARQAAFTYVLAAFGAAALLLSVVGVYGLAANVVALRTREFAVRIALGAGTVSILTMVVGRATLLAGIGAALGIGASIASSRAMRGFVFDLGPLDARIVIVVCLVLFVSTIAASAVPAVRAAGVEPMRILGSE